MAKGRVVHLCRRDPQRALERLNRVTGLSFARWPESLLTPLRGVDEVAGEVVEVAMDDGELSVRHS